MATEAAEEEEGGGGRGPGVVRNLAGHAKMRKFTANMRKLHLLIFRIMCARNTDVPSCVKTIARGAGFRRCGDDHMRSRVQNRLPQDVTGLPIVYSN